MTYRDKTSGHDLLYGIPIGGWHKPASRRLEEKSPIPVLLVLAGDMGEPAMVLYSLHERGEDGQKRIPEAPVKEIRPQGIDGAAVGAAQAPDPQRHYEAFKIPLDVPVSPDAGGCAGETARGPRPRVRLAKLH